MQVRASPTGTAHLSHLPPGWSSATDFRDAGLSLVLPYIYRNSADKSYNRGFSSNGAVLVLYQLIFQPMSCSIIHLLRNNI